MNEQPSPEFEKELREALRAPDANPAFVRDLRATLLERSTMKQTIHSSLRLVWGLVLAALLIGLLVASPQVVQALKRLLGYVPGIGYVEQGSSLRMLTAPAALEKDRMKLTIEKGVADPQHTVLLGRLEGYTPDRYNGQYCDTPPQLILPNGSTLPLRQSETTMEGGKGSPTGSYYVRYSFESMPEGQLEATLEIPCLMQDPALPDWTLELHFETADKAAVMPVIELPTQAASVSPSGTIQTQPTTVSTSPTESTLEGFSIVLESETPLEDGYILSGSYQWTDPRFDVYKVQISDPKLTDANGHSADFETVEPLTSIDPAIRKLPFAYQIHGKNYSWPLTLTVNSVTVNLPDEALFQFDAGTDPQVGQTWDANIDVPVAGHIVHVQSIQLTAGRTPTELGFTFTLTSDPKVMGVSVTDANPSITGNGGGGGGGGGGGDNAESASPIVYGWALEGYSPAGVKTLVVSNLAVMYKGTWQATWQPSTK